MDFKFSTNPRQARRRALLPSHSSSYWLPMVTHVRNNNCIETIACRTRVLAGAFSSARIRKDSSWLLNIESIGFVVFVSDRQRRKKGSTSELMAAKNSLRWLPRELQESFHLFDDVRHAIVVFRTLTGRFLSEINSRVSDIYVSTRSGMTTDMGVFRFEKDYSTVVAHETCSRKCSLR